MWILSNKTILRMTSSNEICSQSYCSRVSHVISLKYKICARERENAKKKHAIIWDFSGAELKFFCVDEPGNGWGRKRAHGCVLERKPRKEFSRDKRRAEEGVGKHRRDIPGKMIIRSWKNFGTLGGREWKKEREKEREKDGECSGDEAAVSCDVTVACSFIVEPFPRETVSTTSNC